MANPSSQYANKTILAPMVRVGQLPFRLLAAEYGADLCYSEELIAHKVARLVRVDNPLTSTTQFYLPEHVDAARAALRHGLAQQAQSEGHVHAAATAAAAAAAATPTTQRPKKRKRQPQRDAVFSTVQDERVVVQLGAAEAGVALRAAQVVESAVCGIDLNMGCPKHFSVSGGMGAALLRKPETAADIVRTLRRNLSVPVTAKVRLLDTTQETLDLCRVLEQAGVAAIGIHARLKDDRPRHPAKWEQIPALSSALSVPLLYNGDVFVHDDIAALKERTGASSIMIARGAMWNASIFRDDGMLPTYDVVSRYVELCQQYNQNWKNVKYCLLRMLMTISKMPVYQAVSQSHSYQAFISEVQPELARIPVLTGPYSPPITAELERARRARSATNKRRKVEPADGDKNGV